MRLRIVADKLIINIIKMKKLKEILIFHRQKHKNGDLTKKDWIYLMEDIRDFIEKEKPKQLSLTDVSSRRELLIGFVNWLETDCSNINFADKNKIVDGYIKAN